MGARTLAAVGHGGLEPRGGGVSQQKLPESGAAAIEVFHGRWIPGLGPWTLAGALAGGEASVGWLL